MQQQPGIVTHSRISSLLISRHLTRPRVASRYSVRTSSVTGSGRDNPKICGRTSHGDSLCSPILRSGTCAVHYVMLCKRERLSVVHVGTIHVGTIHVGTQAR